MAQKTVTMVQRVATSVLVLLVAGGIVAQPPGVVASNYDWMQFGVDMLHSGNNSLEAALTPGNVANLHRMFRVSLPTVAGAPPAVADGAPAYLSNVTTTTGVRDLLFLTTKDGYIDALDAQTGLSIWSHQNGPGSCTINNGSTPCYTTSSPAVDPGRHYVYSYGLDGYVHKYDAGSGIEAMGGGWPELATTKAFDEKGSAALSIATARNGVSYLYVSNGGYPGDNGDYQGHITAINLSTGSQNVFNTLCSNQAVHFVHSPSTPDCGQVQSAVWARPGVVYDPETDLIYLATGNGPFNVTNHDWGDSILALHPDGTGTAGSPVDSYTPANYQSLQSADADLGSTAPAILPVPSTSSVKHLAVQGGKDSMLRLVNLDKLSGKDGPGHTGGEVGTVVSVPQGGEVLTQPAVWKNPADGNTWVFVANSSGVSGLHLVVDASGTPNLQTGWTISGSGTSPIVANGVLYVAHSGAIRALAPLTGAQLWSDSTIGGIHWESPMVANGILYITDESGMIAAYGLPTPTSTTITVQGKRGWNMVGGRPVPSWSDAQAVWSWNALTGMWSHLSTYESPGTGAWEELATDNATEQVPAWICTSPVSVPSQVHRWNMVGNPCSVAVSLENTLRAFLWDPVNARYVVTTTIPAGAAAWVFPVTTPVTLTPTA